MCWDCIKTEQIFTVLRILEYNRNCEEKLAGKKQFRPCTIGAEELFYITLFGIKKQLGTVLERFIVGPVVPFCPLPQRIKKN